MATAAQSRGRGDIIAFVACIVISFLAMVVPGQDVIAGGMRRTIVAPLLGLQRGAQQWRNAWLRREQLMLVADSAAMRGVDAHGLAQENAQLRSIIGLGRRLGTGFIPAEALQAAVTEDYHYVTALNLTAGTNAGIRKYSPVITADGLVGIVQSADPGISVAILYTDPDFRASAVSEDGAAFGIVLPHLEQGVRDRDRQYMLEMRDVPFRSSLKPGARIFTSGLGGTFPAGIPIGTVVRELTQTEGLSHTYLVTPAVDPSKLTDVIVLTPQRASQGIGNIWTTGIGLDSAARRLAAAGDSLAKTAAAQQANAQAAAQDSSRRALIDSVLRSHGIVDTTLAKRDTTKVKRDTTTKVRHDTAAKAKPRPDSGTRGGGQ